MPNGLTGTHIGLLSFLSFGFSVIAAVLAIDMYRLLRTGEYGRTWRLLIITSVMFALMQVLRMGEFLNWTPFSIYGLSQIVELVFVISLAYTFYLQRRVFTLAAKFRQQEDPYSRNVETPETSGHPNHEQEWSRIAGYYAGYQETEATERLLSDAERFDDERPGDDEIEWSPRTTPAHSTARAVPPTPKT